MLLASLLASFKWCLRREELKGACEQSAIPCFYCQHLDDNWEEKFPSDCIFPHVFMTNLWVLADALLIGMKVNISAQISALRQAWQRCQILDVLYVASISHGCHSMLHVW